VLGQRNRYCFENELNCREVRKVNDDDDVDDNGDDRVEYK
jgi:hypothetical protein